VTEPVRWIAASTRSRLRSSWRKFMEFLCALGVQG
jgi:hypothetical protein